MRKLQGATQDELANCLGVKQSSIPKLKNQSAVHSSTRRRIVEALGGELEISAKLTTGRITVSQFGDVDRHSDRLRAYRRAICGRSS